MADANHPRTPLPEEPGDRAAQAAHAAGAGRDALLRSFIIGGFESACHINSRGSRLDMITATQHDRLAHLDYALLRSMGIQVAREGIRWHRIDRGGRYDFSELLPRAQAAAQMGMQVIWNLCHYGWPDDVDILGPAFVGRFARYCRAACHALVQETPPPRVFTPINEMSFIAWAIGVRGFMYPYLLGQDHAIKRQLVRAALAGIHAVWEVDPAARILFCEPLIHVLTPRGRPDLAQVAAIQHESQFEVWDMITGRAAAELGGKERYLDLMGVNYYHSNQWEHPDQRLRWEDEPRDERWLGLHELLARLHQRYRRDLIISETSHFGSGRARWMREISSEAAQALARNVPLRGLCLYPILDRPDWEEPGHWHKSGLWDLEPDGAGKLQRVLHQPYAREVKRAQSLLEGRQSNVGPGDPAWAWDRDGAAGSNTPATAKPSSESVSTEGCS